MKVILVFQHNEPNLPKIKHTLLVTDIFRVSYACVTNNTVYNPTSPFIASAGTTSVYACIIYSLTFAEIKAIFKLQF